MKQEREKEEIKKRGGDKRMTNAERLAKDPDFMANAVLHYDCSDHNCNNCPLHSKTGCERNSLTIKEYLESEVKEPTRCKHQYKLISIEPIEGSLNKKLTFECKKCHKVLNRQVIGGGVKTDESK